MNKQAKDLLSLCKDLSFGKIIINNEEEIHCKVLNDHMTGLCRSLPESMQSEAIMFLMRYAGISIGESMDFFKNYHAPAWSTIYWIADSKKASRKLNLKEYSNALKAQAMAMSLHSLDDHIHDGDISATHLLLLLRSQAWLLLNSAIDSFSEDVEKGRELADRFINNYYSGISSSEELNTLDEFCTLFRKQMATWLIIPLLTAKKLGTDDDFMNDMRMSYESFGIAWRILDDVNDIDDDFLDGARSSIYYSLPKHGKKIWDSMSLDQDGAGKIEDICNIINENYILKDIVKRICLELDNAAEICIKHDIEGLAVQYRTLAGPLDSWLETAG